MVRNVSLPSKPSMFAALGGMLWTHRMAEEQVLAECLGVGTEIQAVNS